MQHFNLLLFGHLWTEIMNEPQNINHTAEIKERPDRSESLKL